MISDKGRVKNCMRNKILTLQFTKDGYHQVSLYSNGKSKSHRVNRLVAKAFIPNPDNLPEVNHLDEVKTNNFTNNLEWVTRQMNIEYSQSEVYLFISPLGDIVEVNNLNKFSRDNGLCKSHMHSVASGKRKHHKGWRKYNG